MGTLPPGLRQVVRGIRDDKSTDAPEANSLFDFIEKGEI
jgi:hypothetical protein